MKKIISSILTLLSINLVSAQLDLVGQAKGLFGGFNLGTAWNILSYGILALVIGGVVAFFLKNRLMKKKFNKTITFFKRNPQTGLLAADRNIKAMTIRLDTFGNLGYRLEKSYETRNLIPKLKYEAKPNHHYVEYCVDGKIVEIAGFTDYDDKRKSIRATFIDENTELGRSSMHQMNKERYEKTKFWKEHASLLVNIGAIVVIMVFLWLIADKLIGLVSSIQGVVNQMGEIQLSQSNMQSEFLNSASNIIDSLNNLLTQNNLTS